MGFREAIGGEGHDFGPQLLCHLALDAVGLAQAGKETAAQCGHLFRGALRAHGAAQVIGLGAGKTGGVDSDLHQLLLKKRDAQRLAQRFFQHRMVIGHLLKAVAAAQVGVHGPALDRAGANKRDLDHQVKEAARLQTRQRG